MNRRGLLIAVACLPACGKLATGSVLRGPVARALLDGARVALEGLCSANPGDTMLDAALAALEAGKVTTCLAHLTDKLLNTSNRPEWEAISAVVNMLEKAKEASERESSQLDS